MTSQNISPRKRWLRILEIEELILLGTLILAAVGIAITDVSPARAHTYWLTMVVVFAFAALALGWSKARLEGRLVKGLLIVQAMHWGATWAAVAALFMILDAGRLNYDNIALVTPIVLGLSVIIDGIRVDWRFSLVGLLLGATSVMTAYMEASIWLLLILALLIAVAILTIGHLRRQARQ